MIRSLIAAVFAFIVSVAPAFAQQHDVSGWWKGRVAYGEDVADLYVGFVTADDGRQIMRISMPAARVHAVGLGIWSQQGDTINVSNANWTFVVRDNGAALDGQAPELAPGQNLSVHLVRAEAPTPPAPIVSPVEPPTPAWTVELGSEIWGGLVHNPRRNLIYVGTDGGDVVALDARTGVRVWTRPLGAAVHAAPTLHANRLYVASDDALVALDAGNGRELWRAPFGAQRSQRLPISDPNSVFDHYSASATVDRDLVFVGARDGCVRALVLRTGAERWRHCIEALVTSTPAVQGDRVFFAGFDGAAYALSRADGHVLWRRETGQAIPRDAVIAGDNVLFGSRTYDLFALRAADGEIAWRRHFWFSWVDSPQVVRDGVIYSGASDGMHVQAFDLNGNRLWASPMPGWTWPQVAVGADTIYVSAAGAERYFQPRAGAFLAINRQDGALKWMFPVTRPEGVHTYGFAAAPVIAGRRVFTADLTGRVYAFDTP